jgi:hypothetical protein
MPTTVNQPDLSYAGKYAGEYLRAAFLANESLQHVTVKENIPYKAVVKRLTNDITFAAPTCDFTPTGTVTINERYLTLEKFQVQENICLNSFLNDWSADSYQNGKIEPALMENLMANMLEGIAAKNEQVLWTGANANVGEYDGLLTLIGNDADGDVNFVASPVAIDPSNVVAKLQLLIAQLPQAVKRSTEKPLIYFSPDVFESYMYAQISNGNGWYPTAGPVVGATFMGLYNIVVCPGLPVNTMLMSRKSNFWFGTNLVSDWNEVKVVDMTQWAEDNVRFSAKFFGGAQYGIGSEIAAYSTWF